MNIKIEKESTVLFTCPYVTDDEHLQTIRDRLRMQYAHEGGDPMSHTAELLGIAEELYARRTGKWPAAGLEWCYAVTTGTAIATLSKDEQ